MTRELIGFSARPFATIAARFLHRLGGRYAQPARLLTQNLARQAGDAGDLVETKDDFTVEDLRARIGAGQVLVVAGEGVSLATTAGDPRASRLGLLREGVARCEQVLPDLPVGWGDRMRHMIDKGDIDSLNKAAVEYASRLESSSGGEFRSFLRDFVASLQVVDPGVIRALDDLGVPLTTINVDDLIERVTGRPPVTWRDPDRMARAVRGDEPGVAHLYGYWEDPESIIPGLSDFERGSGSHLLGEASRGKLTCLFVGCSDIAGDPLLLSLLRRANPPDRESVRHVLLARDSEAGALGARLSPEDRISVLSYGDSWADLESFLRSLVLQANLPARPPCFGRPVEIDEVVRTLLAPAGPASRRSVAEPLSQSALFRLVNALSGIDAFIDSGRRDLIIHELPMDVRMRIPRSSIPHVDITNIVRRTTEHPSGLKSLFQILRAIEGDSVAMRRAEEVFEEVGAGRESAAPPAPLLIHGGPGIGKSTVALAALYDRRVAASYGRRRYLVRCDAASGTAGVLAAIATSLRIKAGPDAEASVSSELARAPAVLVLDDADRPWDAEPEQFASLIRRLRSLPGLAVVVTARGARRDAPRDPLTRVRVGPLPPAASREAFLAIPGAERFATDPRLDVLLDAVDRVPLAVTLLAHVARSLGDLADLWRDWTSRGVAMLGEPGEPHRLTDVRESVEFSLRSPQTSRLARRLVGLLSSLPDGIALSDAVDLGTDDMSIRELRDSDLDDGNPARVRLLAIVRDHVARASWPDPSELPRLIQFYARLIGDLGPKVAEPGSEAALSRLDGEYRNIEAMLTLGLDAPDPRPAIEAARALKPYLLVRGTAPTQVLEQAAETAMRVGDREAQARCLDALGEVAQSRNAPRAATEFWIQAGILYRDRGNTADALRLDELVLRIFEAANGSDHPDTLATRLGIADLIAEKGDVAEALQLYHDLLPDLARVLGPDDRATLTARLRFVDMTRVSGARAEALRLYREMLPDLARVLGHDDPGTQLARFSVAALTDPDIEPGEPERRVPPARTITLGLQSSPAMALAMVARDRNLFEKIGVELRGYDAGKVALRAFLAGTIDYAISGEVPVALAVLNGSYIRARGHRNTAAPKVVAQVVERTVDEVRIVAVRDGDLTAPTSYFKARRRKIATSFGGGPEFFTYTFLKRHGIGRDAVEILSQKPEDVPAALLAGSVDAIFIFDPFAYIAEQKMGDKAITFTDSEGYSELYVLNARPDQVETEGPTIERLVRGLSRAVEAIEDDPEGARAIVRKYTKLDEGTLAGIWNSFVWGTALTPELLRVWEAQAAWAKETGKVPPHTVTPDFYRILVKGFAPKAKP